MAGKIKAGKRWLLVDKASQKSDKELARAGWKAELRIYQEKPGDVPFLDFLADRKDVEKADIRAALERLGIKGHELRPPLNEHLGDQIYYLRISSEDGSYRVFYWPYGRGIVILGHGFSKKSRRCPPAEIDRAKRMRRKFQADPDSHTYQGECDDDQGAT